MNERALRILAMELQHQHKEVTEPLVYPSATGMSRKKREALALRGSILFDLAIVFTCAANQLEEEPCQSGK